MHLKSFPPVRFPGSEYGSLCSLLTFTDIVLLIDYEKFFFVKFIKFFYSAGKKVHGTALYYDVLQKIIKREGEGVHFLS